jgi:hypothetical protein
MPRWGKSLGERFVDKINKTNGCWYWTGAKTPKGYGKIVVNGKTVYAHRLSWVLYCGPALEDIESLLILHKCDTPSCVNPKHLFVGTHSDNAQDAANKGRNPMQTNPERLEGERNGEAKLTEEQIVLIIKEYIPGIVRQVDLASKYNVSQTTISSVVNRRSWDHVTLQ